MFNAFDLRNGLPVIININEISSVTVSSTSKDYSVIHMNNGNAYEVDFSVDRFIKILGVESYERRTNSIHDEN